MSQLTAVHIITIPALASIQSTAKTVHRMLKCRSTYFMHSVQQTTTLL